MTRIDDTGNKMKQGRPIRYEVYSKTTVTVMTLIPMSSRV